MKRISIEGMAVHQGDLCLTSLPAEILSSILSSTFPASIFDYSYQSNEVIELFTHPLLQTCRLLRQRGLDHIHSTFVWIHVLIPVFIADARISDLPFLPISLWHLVGDNASRIHIKFTVLERPHIRITERKFYTFLMPFSFCHALSLCGKLSEIAGYCDFVQSKLEIRCDTIKTIHRTTILRYFGPCLLNLHNFHFVEIKSGDSIDCVGFSGNDLILIRGDWNLEGALRRTEMTFSTAMQLDQSGHVEEAGLLLLFTGCLIRIPAHMPPSPYKWSSTCWEGDERELCTQEEALKMQNRLRTTVCFLEYIACLYFVQFRTKFGDDWCKEHNWAFSYPFVRFTVPANPLTFGLSRRDRGRLHYGAALMFEILYHLANSDPHYRSRFQIDYDIKDECPSKNMIMHAELACMYDGENAEFGYPVDDCVIRPEDASIAEGRARAKAQWSEFKEIDEMGHCTFEWVGDIDGLQFLDPPNPKQFLARAELGAEVSPCFARWVEDFRPNHLSSRFPPPDSTSIKWKQGEARRGQSLSHESIFGVRPFDDV